MNKKEQLEITRNILNNAVNMNLRKQILLKISQKFDKYVVEYYQKALNQNSIHDKEEST